MKKILYLSMMLLLFAGCEETTIESYSDYIEDVAIEALALSIDEATEEGENYGSQLSKVVSIYDTFDLKAKVLPADAASQWYTWEVEDEDNILSFDSEYGGTVTANNVGTAKITARAKSDESITATLDITIHKYVMEKDITLTAATNSNIVVMGETWEMDMSIANGKIYESLVWSLSNGNAAIYGSTNKESIKVVGVSTGDVTLTATLYLGDDLEPVVIEYPMTVVDSYVALADMTFYADGKELVDGETLTMWVGETVTLTAVATPDDTINKGYVWSFDVPSSQISYDYTDSGECVVSADRMGSVSISITADCAAGGEYIAKELVINIKATPAAGFYCYDDFTYSEDLESDKTVLGFIYSVDTESKIAYVISRETPYSPNGTTGVQWATSSSTHASEQFCAYYEGNGGFSWYTTNAIGDGHYNMMVAQYAGSTFSELPSFKAIDDMNTAMYGTSIDYSQIYLGNLSGEKIWYLPTGGDLAVICQWISTVSGGDYTAMNTLLATTGRTCAKTFSNFTGGTRLWGSYDNNGNSGNKTANYWPTATGYTNQNQLKTQTSVWLSPTLYFSYDD